VCLMFTVTRVPGLCILNCVSCVHCYPCSWIVHSSLCVLCSLLSVFLDCAFFIVPSVLPNDILLFSKHITFRNIGITLGFSECSYCLFYFVLLLFCPMGIFTLIYIGFGTTLFVSISQQV
jgi:hypothetical protein